MEELNKYIDFVSMCNDFIVDERYIVAELEHEDPSARIYDKLSPTDEMLLKEFIKDPYPIDLKKCCIGSLGDGLEVNLSFSKKNRWVTIKLKYNYDDNSINEVVAFETERTIVSLDLE